MKKLMTVALLLVAAVVCGGSEYYKVSVSRVDQDLYKDTNTGIYIQTRYCYEYVYYQSAVLKYDQYSYDNKLIFNNASCDVVKVFK